MDLFEKDAPPDRIAFDPDRAPTLLRANALLWTYWECRASRGWRASFHRDDYPIAKSEGAGQYSRASFNEKYVEPFNWPLIRICVRK